MSAQTKAALEAAVAAHFADEEDGAMCTGFVVSMSGITPTSSDQQTLYSQDSSTGLPFHSILGLIKVAELGAAEYWAEDDE